MRMRSQIRKIIAGALSLALVANAGSTEACRLLAPCSDMNAVAAGPAIVLAPSVLIDSWFSAAVRRAHDQAFRLMRDMRARRVLPPAFAQRVVALMTDSAYAPAEQAAMAQGIISALINEPGNGAYIYMLYDRLFQAKQDIACMTVLFEMGDEQAEDYESVRSDCMEVWRQGIDVSGIDETLCYGLDLGPMRHLVQVARGCMENGAYGLVFDYAYEELQRIPMVGEDDVVRYREMSDELRICVIIGCLLGNARQTEYARILHDEIVRKDNGLRMVHIAWFISYALRSAWQRYYEGIARRGWNAVRVAAGVAWFWVTLPWTRRALAHACVSIAEQDNYAFEREAFISRMAGTCLSRTIRTVGVVLARKGYDDESYALSRILACAGKAEEAAAVYQALDTYEDIDAYGVINWGITALTILFMYKYFVGGGAYPLQDFADSPVVFHRVLSIVAWGVSWLVPGFAVHYIVGPKLIVFVSNQLLLNPFIPAGWVVGFSMPHNSAHVGFPSYDAASPVQAVQPAPEGRSL